jgi:hypothetical protein
MGNVLGIFLVQEKDYIYNLQTSRYNNIKHQGMNTPVLPKITKIRDSFNGHEYLLIQVYKNWNDAKIHCESLGGYLVTINNQEENDFIEELIGLNEIYIGFTDNMIEGDWQWVSGEAITYTNWDTGQPDDFGGDEDYAFISIDNDGLWSDNRGTAGRYYVCEWGHPELSEPSIIYPNGGETIQGIVTLKWAPSIDSGDHSVNYDIFFSSDNGIQWYEIASELTHTRYDWDTTEWDTTELTTGKIFLIKVVATCTSGEVREDTSDDIFTIHYLTSPTISISSRHLQGTVTIQWSASTDSLGQNITYSVHYSTDNGLHWEEIASELTTTSYDWNTTNLPDGHNYKIKVNATSFSGLSKETIFPNNISIDNIPADNTFLLIGIAIIAIIPEFYLGKKVRNIVNRNNLEEGVEEHD